MTRATFQEGLVDLLEAHHPNAPADLATSVQAGVETMIQAAVRSAGDGSLRPEVIYAIRASKLAARLLPAEVYRDPAQRAKIKAAIRALVRRHLTPADDEAPPSFDDSSRAPD